MFTRLESVYVVRRAGSLGQCMRQRWELSPHPLTVRKIVPHSKYALLLAILPTLLPYLGPSDKAPAETADAITRVWGYSIGARPYQVLPFVNSFFPNHLLGNCQEERYRVILKVALLARWNMRITVPSNPTELPRGRLHLRILRDLFSRLSARCSTSR